MKVQRFGIALTVVNALLLAVVLTQSNRPALASDTPAMLRGRGLEIVDEQGRVRASITVFPAKTEANGTKSAETVLLRLITERGRPAIKISTSEEGSGMAIVGPTGTHQTYVSLGAYDTATTVKLKNEDGRERTIVP
ncbi:MAG TPA: hypothetical protein VKB50_19055 [Vicinamibacterales bacterium]|nr:hypothetical protein [Vicinamibacterales bacterium]